jgi:hypothetical protein
VSVDQPDLSANNFSLQKLVVIDNTVHSLDAGIKAPAIAGLSDHHQEDKYLLGLGVNGASNSNCLAFSVSLAGGRFAHVGEHYEASTVYRTPSGQACTPSDAGTSADAGSDAGVPCSPVQISTLVIPPDAGVEGIKDGRVSVTYAGGCAFGPFVAGAVLTLSTGYTGHRTGAFDPPPYTPAPVVLPDAGYDGGLVP